MIRVPSLLFLAAICTSVAAAVADEKPTVKVEFRRAERQPAEGLIEATVQGTNEKIYLHKEVELTNKDIAEARATVDNTKQPAVEIIFTKDGGARMKKLTEAHLEKPLAVLVDGKVISAPIVKSAISQKAVITGKFTKEEVEKLVKGIQGK